MASEWYVSIDGSQKGPLSTLELKRWIAEKKVAPDTFVREGANGPWMPVRHVQFPPTLSPSQILLNVIGLAAVLVIGVEAFLFMLTHPVTARLAPGALAFFVVLMILHWSGLGSKKPAKSGG